MATVKPISFRLTAEDLALLDAVQAKLGVLNRTDVLRIALRRLAEVEGVAPKRARAKR